jgi:uncharacterized membrane-anchored protein
MGISARIGKDGRENFATAVAAAVISFGMLWGQPALAGWAEQLPDDAPPEVRTLFEEFDKLQWVQGPTRVMLAGNADLQLPEGFVFLNPTNTQRFLELNQNLGDGDEVLVAPEDLSWMAYLSFLEEGYVKDDEEIDANVLLEQLKSATEAANAERRQRGWDELHVTGWATPPNYNRETKRLEWAARHQSSDGEGVNFFTKILGRRGHMSVQMVGETESLPLDQASLNGLLAGFSYNEGDRYADFSPGDKVAEYGLAAMVVGGAAAVATKKGLWPAIGAFIAASWKVLAAAAVAALAGLRRFFGQKDA